MGIFGKKKKKEASKDLANSSINTNQDSEHTTSSTEEQDPTLKQELSNNTDQPEHTLPTGDKGADLMFLIGKAINEWAVMYNLTNMPKKVIFGQALSLMNSLYEDFL